MTAVQKFWLPRSDTVQPHPKDLQDIPEQPWRGIQLTNLRICDRQQKPSQRGRLLYRNSSQEENPSCKAEGEFSKTYMPAPWYAHFTMEKEAYTSLQPHNSPGHSNYPSQYQPQIISPAENKAISRILTHYMNM